jgi:hypothetical protein
MTQPWVLFSLFHAPDTSRLRRGAGPPPTRSSAAPPARGKTPLQYELQALSAMFSLLLAPRPARGKVPLAYALQAQRAALPT